LKPRCEDSKKRLEIDLFFAGKFSPNLYRGRHARTAHRKVKTTVMVTCDNVSKIASERGLAIFPDLSDLQVRLESDCASRFFNDPNSLARKK
jgi:hypothetical protein